MAYFPFFMELTGVKGLIAGGGEVALRKVEKLLPYGPELTVCAPELRAEFGAVPDLTLLREPFHPGMLEGMGFVIAATDDTTFNRDLSRLCQEKNIPVNVVDDRSCCTFLFPALVKRGELSIGISTGGASPTGAIYVKKLIDAALPDGFGEILAFLDGVRPQAKARIPREERRAAFFKDLFSDCMDRGGPLDISEVSARLEQEEKEGTDCE